MLRARPGPRRERDYAEAITGRGSARAPQPPRLVGGVDTIDRGPGAPHLLGGGPHLERHRDSRGPDRPLRRQRAGSVPGLLAPGLHPGGVPPPGHGHSRDSSLEALPRPPPAARPPPRLAGWPCRGLAGASVPPCRRSRGPGPPGVHPGSTAADERWIIAQGVHRVGRGDASRGRALGQRPAPSLHLPGPRGSAAHCREVRRLSQVGRPCTGRSSRCGPGPDFRGAGAARGSGSARQPVGPVYALHRRGHAHARRSGPHEKAWPRSDPPLSRGPRRVWPA